ncbi:MAG: endo-1,4-beta-xylanase [Clostridiales bacterium]|jgi:endo-1,4-beta-xylanase|nr:endo-1,4-beta-xylanase [Clostridiales bacterium]
MTTINPESAELPKWDLTLPSIAAVYDGKFLIGNIMEPAQTADEATTAMFNHHYNSVTAENAMKPANLSPAKGEYDYRQADMIIAWAEANGIPVHGHTLVWHSQSAVWLTTDGEGNALAYEEAKANMEDYISNVAAHFAGHVTSWDVVNEAFGNSVDFTGGWKDGLRTDSPWYLAYANGGNAWEFIYDAFKLARRYDPAATLYYNDFNEQEAGKSQAICAMVTELNAQWEADHDYDGCMLVEGIGMQSHHNTGIFKIEDFRAAMERYIATVAVVSLTELDITVGPADPYPLGETLSKEDELLQAKLYAQIFDALGDYAEYIERVTFWAKADSQSWRGGRLPGLFDGMFAAKESFNAVIDPGGYLTEDRF